MKRDFMGQPGRGKSGINVNQAERVVSAVLGGVLLARGLKRHSLGGAVVALAGGELLRRSITGHSMLYQKLGMGTSPRDRAYRTGARTEAMEVARAITIGKPADELYRLWRDPQVQPQIMAHFAEIRVIDENHAHWVVRAPMLERSIEWDTEVVEDRPGELIRWRAQAGAPFTNEGMVQFRPAPGGRGTEVVLRVQFTPPAGAAGKAALKLVSFVPGKLEYKALWRFKALVETGEIPTIRCQPAARNGGRDVEEGGQCPAP